MISKLLRNKVNWKSDITTPSQCNEDPSITISIFHFNPTSVECMGKTLNVVSLFRTNTFSQYIDTSFYRGSTVEENIIETGTFLRTKCYYHLNDFHRRLGTKRLITLIMKDI